jgi:hypothetical protein
MTDQPHFLVLFVDLLGFADLTEAHPELTQQIRTVMADNSEIIDTDSSIAVKRYIRFRDGAKHTARTFSFRAGSTCLLFSDCAVFALPATDRMATAYFVRAAQRLMHGLLDADVPARMGIGAGHFYPHRFSSETITVSNGTSGVHSAEFHGTAMVRAYRAERSSKGLRILVHPSAIDLLSDMDTLDHIAFPDPQPHCTHEINYLSAGREAKASRLTDEAVLEHVQTMQMDASPSPQIQVHYSETIRALNRMRAHRGRPAWIHLERPPRPDRS